MHVVIINGSPRTEKNSNTEKIIDAFTMGNTEIIIALPLYVESAPGILLEFLETLPVKITNTRMSFILQGGFAEASQLECGSKRRVDYKPWI